MRLPLLSFAFAALALAATGATAAAPRGAADPAYVADGRCVACHQDAGRAWGPSHHARAMQPANPATVRGDFGNRALREGADTVRLFRRGERFFARARGADGRMRDHRILYTFGVEPLQQYLVAAPGGRLQALTAAWDTGRRRWFSLDPEGTAPGDAMHWSGRYRNWNLMCAECHSSGVEKHYDPRRDAYRTTWTAISVGCQACHGPGRAHADSARRGKPTPMPVAFSADPAREIGLCARCHSVRSRITGRDRPGEPLLDHFRPETLRPGLFHADGQQDGEVFEVASFRQSRMHEAGVRCSDCHEPHSARLRRPGDATCTGCHSPRGDPRFPTAAGRGYEDVEHHFHAPGKPGSRCVDCHMPARDYMVVHPRRDHAIRVPRPELAPRTGAPQACASCHPERSAGWAAGILRERARQGPGAAPGDTPERHYGEIFAAARRGHPGVLPDLTRLAVAPGQPAIVRATAADLLAASGARLPPGAFADPDGEVRAAAAGALAAGPHLTPLLALLDDPLRAVRIAAARSLAAVPAPVPEAHRGAYRRALAEYEAAQAAMADAPAARLALGLLEEDRGRRAIAEGHYRAALEMDRRLDAARLALAESMAARGDAAGAANLLREGIALSPGSPDLRRALAALAAEETRGTR